MLMVSCSADDPSEARPIAAVEVLADLREPSAAEQRAQILTWQMVVKRCMAAEGFEYHLEELPKTLSESEAASIEPEDFQRLYGYGWTLEVLGEATRGPAEDPQNIYVNSLTESELESYWSALNGQPNDEMDRGCFGQADKALMEESPVAQMDAPVVAALEAALSEVSRDARVVSALAKWADCMRARSPAYDFRDPGDLRQYFDEQRDLLVGPPRYDGPSLVIPEGVEANPGPPVSSEPTTESYDQLQAIEIILFEDDLECQRIADMERIRENVAQEVVDLLEAESG